MAANISLVNVELPSYSKGLAFVLYNVLTPEECEAYIKLSEDKGYEKALLNIGGGVQILATDHRNSDRCLIDDAQEADKIWQRIKSYVPKDWQGHSVVGLNERLRFLRYDPGHYFKPHMDGNYHRENGETSYVTVQIYLNEGFVGGSTTFLSYSCEERIEVIPKTGAVLVFQHNLLHEGSVVEKGRKYALRTDVMIFPVALLCKLPHGLN